MSIVNGREVGQKIDELFTGLVVVGVIEIVVEAFTEAKFEPLFGLVGATLKWFFE